jgi:hypothetical protein
MFLRSAPVKMILLCGQGRVKVGEKRLCRLVCGKPLAFRRSPPPFTPPLGWKAEPSSRAKGVSQGASPRKGEAFPHPSADGRQSRFGILTFGDFGATLALRLTLYTDPGRA